MKDVEELRDQIENNSIHIESVNELEEKGMCWRWDYCDASNPHKSMV